VPRKSAKQKRGRKSKFNPERAKKIVGAIRGGNYREVAAAWGGIDDSTMRRWMLGTSKALRAFRASVIEAEEAAEIEMVLLVRKAAQDDAKHAQWWLERKCHTRWARRDKTELTGAGGKALKIEQATIPSPIATNDVQTQALIRELGVRVYKNRLRGDGAVAGGEPPAPSNGNGNGVGGPHS